MEGNRHYLGSEKKLAITINCRGFNMNTDPWQVTVVNGSKQIVCTRTQNSAVDGDNQWYLLIDTKKLGIGKPKAIIEIDVPDIDFDDEYRHEVYSYPLDPIVKP